MKLLPTTSVYVKTKTVQLDPSHPASSYQPKESHWLRFEQLAGFIQDLFEKRDQHPAYPEQIVESITIKIEFDMRNTLGS